MGAVADWGVGVLRSQTSRMPSSGAKIAPAPGCCCKFPFLR